MTDFVFWLFSGIMVVSALSVILSRNPVNAVLWLVLAFFQAAGLFILAGAEFLAMILIIVYVGAVAVLFLFVVMMLDVDYASLRSAFHRLLPMGLLVGLVLLGELGYMISFWSPTAQESLPVGASPVGAPVGASPIPLVSEVSNTQALGMILYTDYFYLFQAAGLILLVAMIGTIVLTLRVRPGVRKQKIQEQVSRKDVVELRKIPVAKGG